MTFTEFYLIAVAAYVFGNECQKKKVLFVRDTLAVVFILKKGRSKCPYVMKLMRKLTCLAS